MAIPLIAIRITTSPAEMVTSNGRLFAAETVMNSFVGPPLGGPPSALSVPLALAAGTAGDALAALGLLLIVGDFCPDREGPARRLHVPASLRSVSSAGWSSPRIGSGQPEPPAGQTDD